MFRFADIIIRKSFFELLFVSQYLWMGFAPPSFFWTETNDDGPCNSNPYIWPLSWLTQFSLLGGELWFWVLSVDIHVALTNPFSNNISNSARYSALVLGTAAVTATILVNIKPIHYGLSSDPMIWVKDQKNATNWTKVGMFYAFLPLIYVYCGAVAIWARWQIRRGLEVTLQKRKYSVRKQTACKHVFLPIIFILLIRILFDDLHLRCHWVYALLDVCLCIPVHLVSAAAIGILPNK